MACVSPKAKYDVIKKSTLVRLISIKSGCTMGDSKRALEAFLEIVPECLVQNVGVRLDGLGSFIPVATKIPTENFLRSRKIMHDISPDMTYEEYLRDVWQPAINPSFKLCTAIKERVKKESRGTDAAREAYGDSCFDSVTLKYILGTEPLNSETEEDEEDET